MPVTSDASAHPVWQSITGLTLLLSAFLAVIVFLPAEGRVSAPLHTSLESFLGRATFMLPLAVAFVGVLLVVRQVRPDSKLPRRRLTGIALLALAVLPIEHLLGGGEQGTGLVGQWLSGSLLDLLGGAGAGLVLLVLLGAGILLAFDVKPKLTLKVAPTQPDAAS